MRALPQAGAERSPAISRIAASLIAGSAQRNLETHGEGAKDDVLKTLELIAKIDKAWSAQRLGLSVG